MVDYFSKNKCCRVNTALILKNLEKNISFEGVYNSFPEFRKQFHYAIKRLESLKCRKCVKIYPHKIFCDSKVTFEIFGASCRCGLDSHLDSVIISPQTIRFVCKNSFW